MNRDFVGVGAGSILAGVSGAFAANASPARTGINPFTKQETVFKAKPARNVVKAQPLKSLKDMVK